MITPASTDLVRIGFKLIQIDFGPALTILAISSTKDNHAWLFLAPNGDIFHAGPSRQMHWVTVNGNGSVRGAGSRGNDDDAMNGNAMMFDIGTNGLLRRSTKFSHHPFCRQDLYRWRC